LGFALQYAARFCFFVVGSMSAAIHWQSPRASQVAWTLMALQAGPFLGAFLS
jgi:hypothetical protein